LFPEGLSRYQSGMAPLKNGVGYIALELLKRAHDAGNDDFTVTVSCTQQAQASSSIHCDYYHELLQRMCAIR
jgi:hypothetical protein